MKRLMCLGGFFFCLLTVADFKILNNATQFRELINGASVPVIVQFSAYWCNPCQSLKATFTAVAKDYSDDQVIMAYVDAYENSELKTYLLGGYPTTRVFYQQQLLTKKFVGSNSQAFVHDFVDSVIADPTGLYDGSYCPN